MRNNARFAQPTGMGCPQCKGFIPINIIQLLTSNFICCPKCGLKLTIDRPNCTKAMEALAKLAEAQQVVEKTSNFNGGY